MALFIPAHYLNDAAYRCPRRQWPAWQSVDVSSPLDDLLGSAFPLFNAAGLSPLQSTNSCPHHAPCKGKQPKSAKRQRPATTWSECVKLPGFAPGEVTAEVKDGRVVIRGRHVQGEGDNQDVVEMRRTLALPPDVDADKVVCRYIPGRLVLVAGPRVQRDATPAAQHAPVETPVQAAASPATVVTGSPAPIDTKRTQKEAASSACCESAAAEGETIVSGEASETETASSCQSPAAESADSSEETMVLRVAGSGDAAASESHEVSSDSEPVPPAPQSQTTEEEAKDTEAAETADSCPDTEHPRTCDEEDAVTKATEESESDVTSGKLTAAVRPTTQSSPEQEAHPPKVLEKPLSLPSQFEAALDLRGFSPENVEVTLNGRSLVVKARRVEDRQYFSSKEEFHRELTLPKNVDANGVRCFLGEDGQLRVTAPYTVAMETVNVPIIAA